MERDPNKRKVKPAQALFDFDDLGESSDDSDFRIEDHCEESDDDSIDSDDNARESVSSEDSVESSDLSELGDAVENIKPEENVNSLSETQNKKQFDPRDALKIMICSVCLGERSDATNEIIECDSCGVTVHEGCYGVQDCDSVCSTDSPCPTTPWFCDACKAGIEVPHCELCPNFGGIFKETDVGKWVHLVCALYMPGVAFAEVDRLSSVTLFEMSYTKWGAKSCSLCQDQRFARTGVAIGCDAGMCKTYFHVTCGQKEGLLSEAHSEEVDQADPFYAHCKLHSDKTLMRKRRRNWLALQMRSDQISKHGRDESELQRIRRRLNKYRTKYANTRLGKPQPWVPTQKMARLLTTSASACRKLWRKAELSGADTRSWEMRQAQVEALSDVHRRWHIQPAFSVEFIGYYLDRNVRVSSMRKQLAELLEENSKLLDEQGVIEEKRDEVVKSNTEECEKNKELKSILEVYYGVIRQLCPNKKLPDLDTMGVPPQLPISHPLAGTGGVPTPAALKAGIGFPLKLRTSTADSSSENQDDKSMNLNNSCGLCYGRNDQHLLAKCDTCKLYYHLGCLNPPLTRMPKKTKLMGWQCSECDKDSDNSDVECVDTEAPRKLRHKDNNDSLDASSVAAEFKYEAKSDEPLSVEQGSIPPVISGVSADESLSSRGGKKRRREKHHRYSPEPDGSSRPHKRKHKRSKQQEEQRHSLKICFKSIPHPTGEGSAYVATPSRAAATPAITTAITVSPVVSIPPLSISALTPQQSKKKEESPILCVTCNAHGSSTNLVRCDECLKGFHFACLDPPVKKSPKVRGYSWHCANCDPTESD